MKWLEIRNYEKKFRPLTFFIGGRGIGKTYSSIQYLIERGDLFLYLRNTQIQIEESCSLMGNPFSSYNRDHGRNIKLVPEKKHFLIVDEVENDVDDEKPIQKLVGYAAALSTFENLRGVDLSEVRYVLFDEFIEKRTLAFNQFDSFSHMYETVSRNRELLGEPPLICFMLSNSQSLFNPILQGYGIVRQIETMIVNGQDTHTDQDYFICLCKDQEVSQKKQNTALYRLSRNSHIYRENIENDFVNDDFSGIQNVKLAEYSPLCCYDDIFIYKHKSQPIYHVTWTSGTCQKFRPEERSLFLRAFGVNLRMLIPLNRVTFSDASIKHKLETEVLKI